ncbi:hypothetical protein GA417_11190 [Poseidonibacter ostreae]|jgi:general secretion pathway protein D|uniref:secretin N-terminal domain-containing protein n=1 Tax=Poseidonibacter ostreae TaxID=2654171 RepID=UPI001265986C|nr:secretin N-terminal domain-containing protein [Poseidonibacter ostreae]KAB7884604.1 hypothetical protein GA417_11190 [Poseidonibacter ostreae]
MKLKKVFLLIVLLGFYLQADEKININFKELDIMELVKITSKILNKNILITQDIKGKVDYISNNDVSKDELVKILIFVLESKGYTLINNENILRIVKLNESTKNNVPIVNSKLNVKQNYNQMATEIFKVNNVNADYIASKVKHLISKNAKLVTNIDSNTLALTDFRNNIKTVKKVIKIMTQGAKRYLEIIELHNIQASEAKKNIDAIAKSMFNEKIQTEKTNIIVNKESNSLVIIGNKTNTNYLKKYIQKIDSKDSLLKRVVEVIALKNVEAKNVIKILDDIISKKKYIDPNAKPLSSVDEESNSIVIMGLLNEINYIKALIEKLDKEKAQVYVQAKIIEVSDSLLDQVGIKYGIFGGNSGKNGLSTFASNLNGGSAISFNPSDIGLVIPTIASGLALGASISLLNQDGALDIVSEPSILAINNKESSIYVGETISVKTSSSVTDGGTTKENFKREDVGLTLKVKPRVSNDNKVTLEINTILEDVKTTATNSGNADTTKKEIQTTAIVKNGESVILGGLIEDKEESTEDKVPGVSEVPIVGKLFTHNKGNIRKRSLVIIVTPYIIPKSKDLTYVRNKLSQLKLLEDKYLKDSLIRLKEKQIKDIKNKKTYELKIKALEEDYIKLKDEENKDVQLNNQSEHEKRVAEILGY